MRSYTTLGCSNTIVGSSLANYYHISPKFIAPTILSLHAYPWPILAIKFAAGRLRADSTQMNKKLRGRPSPSLRPSVPCYYLHGAGAAITDRSGPGPDRPSSRGRRAALNRVNNDHRSAAAADLQTAATSLIYREIRPFASAAPK